MTEDWGHIFDGEATIDYWSPRVAEVLAEQQITKLRIRGWKQPGFEPLLPFRDQIVRIFDEMYDDGDLPDFGGLAQLHKLQWVSLRHDIDTIDFSRLQQLEEVTYSGDTPRFGNLRQARALRTVHVVSGGLTDLKPLAGLDQLTRLHVSEAKVRTVAGIEELRSLESLALTQVTLDNLDAIVAAPWLREVHLYMPRKLRSIAPLVGLPLRVLSIGGTRRIADLDRIAEISSLEDLEFDGVPLTEPAFIGRLTHLKALKLQNVGRSVPSLAFLRDLALLDTFFFFESTLTDGDLSVLLDLPALSRVIVQKRRHYTHDGKDVQAILTARWTKGLGPFANAHADDWIAILWERQPVAWLGTTIRDVLSYGFDKAVPAIASQFAIAAAEVLARLRGRGDGTPAPESLARWLDQHVLEPSAEMVTNAQAALDRLLTEPSGLLRLWEERGQADAWKAAVEDLKRRVAWEPGT